MSLNSDGPRLSALYIKLLKYFPLVSVTTTFSTNSSKYQNFCIIPTNNDEFENEIHSDNDNNYTKCLQILKVTKYIFYLLSKRVFFNYLKNLSMTPYRFWIRRKHIFV